MLLQIFVPLNVPERSPRFLGTNRVYSRDGISPIDGSPRNAVVSGGDAFCCGRKKSSMLRIEREDDGSTAA